MTGASGPPPGPPPGPVPDAGEFRQALGRFATGVTVVAAEHEGVLHGMTANAFTSLSLEPALVLVCVDLEAGMHDFLVAARRFAATMLAADQEELSTYFASPRRPSGTDQFDDLDWRYSPVTGSPVLEGGLAAVDCEVEAVHAGGDHSIFVGRVVAIEFLSAQEPLVFYAGEYHRLHSVPKSRSPKSPRPGTM